MKPIVFNAILSEFDSVLWGHYFILPTAVVKKVQATDVKRFICDIDGKLQHPCAVLSRGDGAHFILSNKDTIKKLKMQIGQEATLTLTEDSSKYGMPMCEELEVMLEEDPEFLENFEKLTPGKRRNIIYAVGKYKSSDIRLRTIVVIADHLKANNGKLDFKLLGEALKGK